MKIAAGSQNSRFTSTWSDLAAIGRDQTRGGYSRHLFDDAEMALRSWFVEQAQRRGLEVETDRNSNVWAWWGSPGPGAVVTGSHLDSVPGGGAFDGPLGVVSSLMAVDELRLRGHVPTKPIAVVCFAEEEGGRFGLPCLGSRLMAGISDADHVRRLRDPNGISLADAARRVGIDPAEFGPDPVRLAMIDSFVELHVEQGRLLQQVDPQAAIAVGSQIVAHGRWRFTFTGTGNHAGTTVPADRKDPMLPAAATVLATRRLLAEHAGAVATVGRLVPVPGGSNVIASSVDLWLDARVPGAAATAALVDAIVAAARIEAELEGCSLVVRRESFSDDVIFDPALGLELNGVLKVPTITTGAGHDAGVLAPFLPTAMLFVRNPTGISHSPAEHAETADALVGIDALADVLAKLTR
ncbi:allantoate amidohydrolase [Nakamurella antarctica]|uniref:Allantoate amidohydrolase n=1 Tax=Nakamurella antarctica TaxID=1902245 RepID=A0A3G8ZK03_9ACTN|nr:allantoate amidohydrolase [Nakamurella antarctica]AZI57508.1 allantoate amidohydrolase [Nakamurella antarctica]